ncbi:protease-associated domain-containing protein 1-like [Patiria miniata]|uniref:PA domain-containing protein n=1 Tax=Patiria miniata TaxID=46514 RepID=A0A914B3L3_PATMI|nr:protease-associated domain-containing protein 1-like [Patiria miniata]
MAASMGLRSVSGPDWRLQKTWQIFLLCSLILAAIRYVHGHGVHENLFFSVLSPEDLAFIYKIRPAKNFGAAFAQHFHRICLIPTEPEDACGELANAPVISGEVALIKRGGCSFMSKAITAERAGAAAVIIYDNNDRNFDSIIDMIDDNTDRSTSIPVAFLLGRDGYMIKNSLHQQGLPSAVISIPVNITGVSLGHVRRSPWSLWI